MAWIGVVTNSGKALFASWINGTVLNFDTVEGGTGIVSEASLLAQTALFSKRQDLSIIDSARVADGIKLTIQITAPETGYTLNQIGIKASVDGGIKALAALFQNADGVTIPGVAQTPDFVYKFFGTIQVSNTGTFTASIDTSALVAQSTLDEAIASINESVVLKAEKGEANGVASLDATGKVPAEQLPAMNYEPIGSVSAHDESATAHTDLRANIALAKATADEAKSIAEGRTRAEAFSDYATAISYLNSAAANVFRTGDAILIATQNVPDMWVYSVQGNSVPYTYTTDAALLADFAANTTLQMGYFVVAESDSEKVDLSGYVPITRTVNGIPLNANITLTASDVSAEPAQTAATQAEAEAGTVTAVRSWTPQRIAQAVRGGILTGLSTATNAVITATDTVMSAIGKLQAQITAHGNLTTAHSAVSTATANRIIIRDANGRAKVAAPSADDDIANKAYVDARGFILRITFDSKLSGKAFTVTATGFSFSGTVPAGLMVDIVVPKEDTAYTITCDGVLRVVSTGQYFGIYPITVERVFADSTWTQIGAVAASGSIPSDWKIGDEKDIVVSGETLTVQIYDFYHDDLQAGGKAALTLGLKNFMATLRRMEATQTNVNSFTGSEMFAWLRDTLLPSLPADLQAVIKPVNKKTSAGNISTTIKTEAMKLFLFSEVECFGTAAYSFPGEGSQYPIFTNTTSRIKFRENGAGGAYRWWHRSPHRAYVNNFTFTSEAGTSTNVVTSAIATFGVCFGFCI